MASNSYACFKNIWRNRLFTGYISFFIFYICNLLNCYIYWFIKFKYTFNVFNHYIIYILNIRYFIFAHTIKWQIFIETLWIHVRGAVSINNGKNCIKKIFRMYCIRNISKLISVIFNNSHNAYFFSLDRFPCSSRLHWSEYNS